MASKVLWSVAPRPKAPVSAKKKKNGFLKSSKMKSRVKNAHHSRHGLQQHRKKRLPQPKRHKLGELMRHLIVVPYYNKPPQRGLVAHFKAAAAAATATSRAYLYNVPGRTITSLDGCLALLNSAVIPKILLELKKPRGDIAFGKKIIEACGPEFLVTSGDDATYLQLIAGRRSRNYFGSFAHILAP